MSDENVTPSRASITQRDLVAAALTSALTSPAALGLAEIAGVVDALRLDEENHDRCRLALSALAAILYSRPDLVESAFVERLATLASTESLPADIRSTVVQLFAFLASSSAATEAWTWLRRILLDERLSARTRERLLPLVGDFARWREDLVGLDGIFELAESMALPVHRAFLLDHGVERFVFCAPEAFTVARLERIATLFEDAPRYRYVLHFLAARRSLPADVQVVLAERLAGRFPLRESRPRFSWIVR